MNNNIPFGHIWSRAFQRRIAPVGIRSMYINIIPPYCCKVCRPPEQSVVGRPAAGVRRNEAVAAL